MNHPKRIDDVEFEAAERDAKGASTEDAGLRILSAIEKKYKREIFSIERIAPYGIGEFDAIVCTDSCLIVVELKRYGGCFWPFQMTDEKICIQTRGRDKWIPNPAVRLMQKSEHMRSGLMNGDDNWKPVKRLFSGNVRIHNLLCFGPSTKFDDFPESMRNTTICTTRNLTKTIENIYSSNTGVVGVGQQMANLVSLWPQWGILTTHRKGFLRAALSQISSSKWDLTPHGLTTLSSDGDNLAYTFANGKKGTLIFDHDVYIKTYVEGTESTISIPPGTRFRWRITGR